MKRILLCTLRWLLKPFHEMREYTWFHKALGGTWALEPQQGVAVVRGPAGRGPYAPMRQPTRLGFGGEPGGLVVPAQEDPVTDTMTENDDRAPAHRLMLEALGWRFWCDEPDEIGLCWRAMVPKRAPYRSGTVWHDKTEEGAVTWAYRIAMQFDQLVPNGRERLPKRTP